MTSTLPTPETPCCGPTGVSRRSILAGAAALGGTLAVSQMFGESMLQASFAGTSGGNTLVVLSLRGGIDGLGVVVPYGDPGYYASRRTTAVPASALICKDQLFGLHPKMAALQNYWTSGQLAAVQATGLPIANRSHFAAIEEIEDAVPGSSVRSGWVNRLVGLGTTHSAVDAVQLGQSTPTTAVGGDAANLAAKDLTKLQLPGLATSADQRYSSLGTVWQGAGGPLATAASQAVGISRGVGQRLATMVEDTAAYPSDANAKPFAEPLRGAAQLIKADLGTDVIAIDAGSWDLHSGYGTVDDGPMQSKIAGFAGSLAAFLDDLGPARQRVTVVTISEFGRRVAENGSGGFDHGWGSMMLVAGAGVKGGQYYGSWPGLGSGSLVQGDLKVTTDYRQVFAEIADRRFPGRSLADLFPGLTYRRTGFLT